MIQHKQEAFWFYRYLSIVYDHIGALNCILCTDALALLLTHKSCLSCLDKMVYLQSTLDTGPKRCGMTPCSLQSWTQQTSRYAVV